MSDAALPLVLAMARALADGRRVLVVGESFEALQLLAAADVRELVLVSDGAAETSGETATGAPLKIRGDWAERAASKDLVVDPAGVAKAADVKRVLKKKGLYVSGRAGAALKGLAAKTELRARRHGALVVGDEPRTTVSLGGDGAEGPTLWVGANGEMPALPGLLCTLDGGDAGAPRDEAAGGERDEARRQAEAATRERDEARRQAEAATRERDEARRQAEAATRERDEARAALETAKAAGEEARRSLAEVEAERDRVQDELSERRVQDRRAELVRAHFEETRQAMHAELEALRARLREVDEPAADLETQRGEHEALRSAFTRVAAALAAAADLDLPAPAPNVANILDTWLERVAGRVAAAREARRSAEAAATALEARLRQAERRARELGEAIAAAQAAGSDPAPAAVVVEAAGVAELRGRLTHLEAALAAEQALRREEQVELLRLRAAADALATEAAALRTRLEGERLDAVAARLSRAALHDETERLRGELSLRDARLADVEANLAEHARMTRLLSETLDEAVQAREAAEGERRLADNNLRLLRAEMEREVGTSQGRLEHS